jgi:hypothetical protein
MVVLPRAVPAADARLLTCGEIEAYSMFQD